MLVIYTKVGEHFLQILCRSTNLVKFLESNYDLYTHASPDITIMLEDNYGIPFTDFNVDISVEETKICYRRSDYLIEVDTEFKHATVSVYDDFALKHAFTNLYSALILHDNWGLLLHSSCAVENNKAHIFSGQSGAGKSTAAKLSAPRELLSDEASIIKITSNEIKVYNSPFRSEMEPTGQGKPKSLASIQLLNQALENKRVRLKRSDALIQLMDKVFYWVHSPDETARIFGLLNKLVENIPVYELYFQKNNRFWELISS